MSDQEELDYNEEQMDEGVSPAAAEGAPRGEEVQHQDARREGGEQQDPQPPANPPQPQPPQVPVNLSVAKPRRKFAARKPDTRPGSVARSPIKKARSPKIVIPAKNSSSLAQKKQPINSRIVPKVNKSTHPAGAVRQTRFSNKTAACQPLAIQPRITVKKEFLPGPSEEVTDILDRIEQELLQRSGQPQPQASATDPDIARVIEAATAIKETIVALGIQFDEFISSLTKVLEDSKRVDFKVLVPSTLKGRISQPGDSPCCSRQLPERQPQQPQDQEPQDISEDESIEDDRLPAEEHPNRPERLEPIDPNVNFPYVGRYDRLPVWWTEDERIWCLPSYYDSSNPRFFPRVEERMTCFLCHGADHYTNLCERFPWLGARMDVVRGRMLCYICLKPHPLPGTGTRCQKSNRQCRNCKEFGHNEAICPHPRR